MALRASSAKKNSRAERFFLKKPDSQDIESKRRMMKMLRSSPVVIIAAILLLDFASRPGFSAIPPELKLLIDQLADKKKENRLEAAKELGLLKEKAKEAIPALIAAAMDEDPDVRLAAKQSLAEVKIAILNSDRLTGIARELQSKNKKNCLAAIDKLEKMGADAKDEGAALVQFGIMNPDSTIAKAASRAFEKIDPNVYREVITIYIDVDDDHRALAIHNLGKMGPKAKSAMPMIKSYHEHAAVVSKKAPLLTLKAMMEIDPDDSDVQNIILDLVGGPEEALPDFPRNRGELAPNSRVRIIEIMNQLKIDNKQKYFALMKGLASGSGTDDRVIVILELGKLGVDAKGALPILKELKFSGIKAIRDAAERAMKAIE